MNRRSFFGTMIGGLVASAAVRTWPFRVFSFPSEIVVPQLEIPAASQLLTIEMISAEGLKVLEQCLTFRKYVKGIPGKMASADFVWRAA